MLPCTPRAPVFHISSAGSAEATVAASYAAWSRSGRQRFGRWNGQGSAWGQRIVWRNQAESKHFDRDIFSGNVSLCTWWDMRIYFDVRWFDSMEKWWNIKIWASYFQTHPNGSTRGIFPQKHQGLNNQGLDLSTTILTTFLFLKSNKQEPPVSARRFSKTKPVAFWLWRSSRRQAPSCSWLWIPGAMKGVGDGYWALVGLAEATYLI